MGNLSDKSDAPATRIRWRVLALVAFASSSAYLTRHCIAAANTTIQNDVGFDDVQMGAIMSVFSLGYFICQIPGGWLGTRFGTRFAFPFISAIWSLCNVMSGLSYGYWPMFSSRLLLGCFQAGLVPVSAKVLRDWIPPDRRGVSSAAIGACMSLGGAFTMWFTGWLLKLDIHWRLIFQAYALVGIIWALAYYWLARTLPREHPQVNAAEVQLIEAKAERTETKPESAESNNIYVTMVTSVSMWAFCIQSFFRAAGYAFFVTWFFTFLERVYGVSKSEAGFLTSLPLLAVVVGTSCGGMVVDLLLTLTKSLTISRCGTALAALTLSAVLTYLSSFTNSATQLACVIALGAMFSGIAGPAVWAASIDLGGKQTPVVIATMNMAGSLAGVILPYILGTWFDQIKKGNGSWDNVIYAHAAFYAVAAACWFFIRPQKSLSSDG